MLLMPGTTYVGPPDSNWSSHPTRPPMGMVVHIAEGSYQGTIGWQKNPSSDVSSFFVVSQAGEIAQMLDLNLMAWTQANGNPAWIGVENEGFSTGAFPPAQVSANARIFAFVLQTWPSVPAQVTNSPSTKGLGWHGMGGAAWGNHPNCPGPANVALLPQILAEAVGGGPAPSHPKRGWRPVLPYVLQDPSSIVLAWPDTRVGKWVFVDIIPPGFNGSVNVPQLVGWLISAGAVGNNGGTFGVGSLSTAQYVALASAPAAVPPPVVGEVVAQIPDLVIQATISGTVAEA